MKKTIFKLVILIVISCLASIWIYYSFDKAKTIIPNEEILFKFF